MKTLYPLIMAVFLGAITVFQAFAQTSDNNRFDLVIFGRNLVQAESEIWLKNNPWQGDTWVRLEEEFAVSVSEDPDSEYSMITVSGIPANRYIGGDLRERYLAVRIRTHERGAVLHAVYAVPHIRHPGVESLFFQIRNQPMDVQALSLANHVWPRPHILEPGTVTTEHAEAPVRHLKPGIQEVKWLDVLFIP